METSQSLSEMTIAKNGNKLSANVKNEPSHPNNSGNSKSNHFIEANSEEIDILSLEDDCIVPVFSKDNELTISHPVFIETIWEAANSFFLGETLGQPNIRVSHRIKGRIPSAIHKPVNKLLESDKTMYYERMAFYFDIPDINETINGQKIHLSIGGVRAYNNENLYGRKGKEKFKIFIGYQNSSCCNLCVTTDGYLNKLEATNTADLFISALELFLRYNPEKQIKQMKSLVESELTERQFAQIIGRMQLYQYLSIKEQKELPQMLFKDTQINSIVKAYCNVKYSGNSNKKTNMWNFYNLLTEANRNSYIDLFLDRTLNATELATGISKALNGDGVYRWFIE
ncbi:DUF3871 family protein [Bacteroides sedimenti]|uniref:DUF3871 family protein n=1 Tax=Bacteroides sedimenti TaxID=2136147 RepID=A0ABM8I8P9_9BACE